MASFVPSAPPAKDASKSRVNAALIWSIGFAGAACVPLVGPAFYTHIGIVIALSAISVIGLMIIARVGQLSFCHAAIGGVGAYATGVLSSKYGVSPFVSAALALVMAGALAAGLGWMVLRIRGVYFVLITFAFGQLLGLVFLNMESITGGATGISGIPAFSAFGHSSDSPGAYYFVALTGLALSVAFASRLLATDIGRAFDSVADNIRLAESSGVATRKYQIFAFVVGSMLAALSGVLSVHYSHFATPGSFDNSAMIGMIVMLTLGGRKSVAGAVLGAAFLVPLAELLRSTNQLQLVVYGVIVLLTLRFFPGGIAGAFRASRRIGPPPEKKEGHG